MSSRPTKSVFCFEKVSCLTLVMKKFSHNTPSLNKRSPISGHNNDTIRPEDSNENTEDSADTLHTTNVLNPNPFISDDTLNELEANVECPELNEAKEEPLKEASTDDAEDPEQVSDARASIKDFAEIYLLQAEEICELQSIELTYATDLIFDIKNNENGGWVVIALLAYRRQQETTPHSGGYGKSVDPDVGRKNAMINLANSCRAKGTKISWKTLYEYAKRIRTLVEEPIAELKLSDPDKIKEIRAAKIVDLVAIPSSFAKKASRAKDPVAKLEEFIEGLNKSTSVNDGISDVICNCGKSSFGKAVMDLGQRRGQKPSAIRGDFMLLVKCLIYDAKDDGQDMGLRK